MLHGDSRREIENEHRDWCVARIACRRCIGLDEAKDHVRTSAIPGFGDSATAEPAQYFATARGDLHKPVQRSRAFSRIGPPRESRLLLAAWILFAVSFILPVLDGDLGWRAFEGALLYGGFLGRISALTNVLMLLSFAVLFGHRLRWLPQALAVAAVLNLGFWPIAMLGDGDSPMLLQAGYWAWAISFPCAAFALWRGKISSGVSVERPGEDTNPET